MKISFKMLVNKLYPRSKHDVYALLPFSALGVVAGHMLLYRWLFPNASEHHHELASTGHGYFSSVVAISVCLVLFGLAVLVRARKNANVKDRLRIQPRSFWYNFLVLFLVQAALFVGMELLERLLSQGTHAAVEIITSTFIVYGLLFQLMTAACMAVMVGGAEILCRFLFRLHSVAPCKHQQTFTCRIWQKQYQNSSISIRAPPRAVLL